jgi:hypothetical protein
LVAGEWEIAMNFMASGRSALIITAGLLLCLAGPVGAQQSDQDATANATSDATADNPADAPVVPAKPAKPRAKKAAAAHQPAKMAAKPKKADDADDNYGFPPSVSNAKAQFGAAGNLADNASRSMSPPAEGVLNTARQGDSADPPVASSGSAAPDQVSDADRSASQDTAPAPTLSMAVAPTPYTASSVDSTWGRTSLIGKVFVAVGGLLTLASAARMFIA